MKNENGLSDTMELNVDQARRAVGNLFDNDSAEIEIVSGYADIGEEAHWFEENPMPLPKPAVKVNASHPAASRKPLPMRTSKPLAAEADKAQTEAPAPRVRPVQSNYILHEDDLDDEYKAFRQRYRERDKRAKRALHVPVDEPVAYPPKRKRPPREDYAFTKDEVSALSLPLPIRAVIIGLTVILLLMMAFLVYQNIVLASQLDDAAERLLDIPILQQELSQARINLEAAREDLAAAEAENMRLMVGQAYSGNLPEYDAAGLSDTEGGDPYYSETAEGSAGPSYSAEPAPEEAPAPPPPPAPAPPPAPVTPPAPPSVPNVHTVAAGDNLSRISRHFYGDASHANIQRIIDANNITDPNNIAVGDQLIIP